MYIAVETVMMKPGVLSCYRQFSLGEIYFWGGGKVPSLQKFHLFSPFYFPLLFNFTVAFSYADAYFH